MPKVIDLRPEKPDVVLNEKGDVIGWLSQETIINPGISTPERASGEIVISEVVIIVVEPSKIFDRKKK